MLAISFMLAHRTLLLELRRKEAQGLIKPLEQQVRAEVRGFQTYLISFITGFILGYKFVYAFTNYSAFVENTQDILLSTDGSWPGGILLGALFTYMRHRELLRIEKNPPPPSILIHPWQLTGNLTMIAAISGIIGAKLFHNLENWDDLMRDPVDALLSFSGLTMYGGLIFGTIAVTWYGRKKGIPPLLLADATAPGLMLAYGTGRLGCQLSGDGDWGIVNLNPKPDWLSFIPDWAWAYNYPNNVINEGIPIPGCEGRHCMMLPDAVYPTPLYEAFICIGLFFVLWSFRKKWKLTGMMFFVYLVLNGLERFLIEKIRVNNIMHFMGIKATQAEFISFGLILIGACGLFWVYRSSKRVV